MYTHTYTYRYVCMYIYIYIHGNRNWSTGFLDYHNRELEIMTGNLLIRDRNRELEYRIPRLCCP